MLWSASRKPRFVGPIVVLPGHYAMGAGRPHRARIHRRRRSGRRRGAQREGRGPRRRTVRLERRHVPVLPGRFANVVRADDQLGRRSQRRQAEAVRVPFADGTLVAMPESVYAQPRKRIGALALCDVMGTGHHGVVSSLARAGGTVVIVGDGAIGLCGVLSAAKQVGAERVIAVGHNDHRLALAKQFGATETFNSHDPEVGARIIELTRGGAPSVVEAVGNQESMELALEIARPGGTVSFVGVPANVQNLPLRQLFCKERAAPRGAGADARLPSRTAKKLGHRTHRPVTRVRSHLAARARRRRI